MQTEETAWFDLDKGPGYRKMWTPFMKSMIRELIGNPRRMTFAMQTGKATSNAPLFIPRLTTLIGINIDTVDYADRSTEFWSFSPELTLDARGKRCKHPSVFFYASIFNKLRDGTMLKVLQKKSVNIANV